MAVVDEVSAAVFDAGEGGANGGGKYKVAGLEGGEAAFWTEGMEGDYTWVEHEGELKCTHGFYEAHDMCPTVRGFVPRYEDKGGSGKGIKRYREGEWEYL